MNVISPTGLVQQGWESFKKDWQLILGSVLIIWVVSLVLEAVAGVFENEAPFVSFIVIVLSIIVSIILQLGLTQITLNLVYGKPAEIGQLIGDRTLMLRFFGTSVVYALIVIGGLILLIVPGIIWAIKYSQFSFLIVDRKMDAFASLSESARITSGHKLQLFWLSLLLVVINIAGALLFLVGLLITIPVSVMVYAHVYKELQSRAGGEVVADTADGSESTESKDHSGEDTIGQDMTSGDDATHDTSEEAKTTA